MSIRIELFLGIGEKILASDLKRMSLPTCRSSDDSKDFSLFHFKRNIFLTLQKFLFFILMEAKKFLFNGKGFQTCLYRIDKLWNFYSDLLFSMLAPPLHITVFIFAKSKQIPIQLKPARLAIPDEKNIRLQMFASHRSDTSQAAFNNKCQVD